MNQRTLTRRREVVAGIGVSGVAALAGCAGLNELLGDDDSGVEDSDGDGVVDSEDYAPNDPAVQEKSDVSGNGGADDGTEGSGASDTDATATDTTATDTTEIETTERATTATETTETATPTATEQAPTTAEPTTAGLSCDQVVREMVEVGSGSAATYRVELHRGARLEVTGITHSGQEPGLSVIAPSGRRVVDDAFGQTVRETVTATESGTYIVQFNNGAWLPETGTWEIEIVACTR